MKSLETNLLDFLGQNNISFYIPNYQRNYVWSNSNCRRLLNDIIKVMQGERIQHFFGFIVLKEERSNLNERKFLVIDGQQRLTTFFLIFAAIRDFVLKNKNRFSDIELKIIDGYEQNIIHCASSKRFKLKTVLNDEKYFNTIMNKLYTENDKQTNKHNIGINYKSIYMLLDRQFNMAKFSIDNFDRILKNLRIILLMLDDNDNAQVIFDTMNSTGKALTPGDSIRNMLLMDAMSEEKQNELYFDCWVRIEKNVCIDEMYEVKKSKGDQITKFIWIWLKMKLRSNKIHIDNTYEQLSNYINDAYELDMNASQMHKEDILRELVTYSDFYNFLLTGCPNEYLRNNWYNMMDDIIKIGSIVTCINYLKVTTHYPYALELFHELHVGNLNAKDVIKIFETLESYFFRRSIHDLPTNCYNHLFPGLHSKLLEIREKHHCNSYVEAYSRYFASLSGRSYFPNDDEFSKDISDISQIFVDSKSNSIRYMRFKYLLFKLECSIRGDYNRPVNDSDISKFLLNPDVKIQKLITCNYKTYKANVYDEFDCTEQKFDSVTSMIGNLYLPEFVFTLEQYKQNNSFNVESVEKRTNDLLERSKIIWKKPGRGLFAENIDYYTLDTESTEFIKLKFEKIVFEGGLRIPEEGWLHRPERNSLKWALIAIYKRIHSRYSLYRILNDDRIIIQHIVEEVPHSDLDKDKYRKVDDNLYVNLHANNAQNIDNLKKVFDYFKDDINYDDIRFYIRYQ